MATPARKATEGMAVDLSSLVLNARKLRGDVASAVTGCDLERTIDGSSVLTIALDDHTRALVRSPLAQQAVVATIDGLSFTLTAVSKAGDALTLTLEETAVARLRLQTRPRKASRAKVTRAQFAASLVAELRNPAVPFWCPERNERQKVAGRAGQYEFTRGGQGQPEDSWTALARLAQEVAWRVFCRAGVIVFARDATLLAQPLALSVSERTDGVDAIDFDYDPGKPVQSATITCRIDKWSVPPGSPVALTGCGAADGTWLVQSVSRSFFGTQGRVELTRPQAAKLEPAGQTQQQTSKASSVRTSSGATISMSGVPSGGLADLGRTMVQWGLRYVRPGRGAYVFGANHGTGYPAIRSAVPPFDCSSFAAAAAAQIGVDVVGTTFSQIAAGRVSRAPHGSGTLPPGGFLPGDLVYPAAEQGGHVQVAMGNGQVVQAECTDCGIVVSPISSTPPYFWWRVTALAQTQPVAPSAAADAFHHGAA